MCQHPTHVATCGYRQLPSSAAYNTLGVIGEMKLVIDSNQLQTSQFREFLSRSPSNLAVLPDFAAMEAYKGDSLKTIFKSMVVLADFPEQVIVLKGSASTAIDLKMVLSESPLYASIAAKSGRTARFFDERARNSRNCSVWS